MWMRMYVVLSAVFSHLIEQALDLFAGGSCVDLRKSII